MELLGYFIPLEAILLAGLAFLALIFLITLIALVNSAKANKKMKMFLRENRGTNIIGTVTDYYEKCQKIESNFFDVNERIKRLENEDNACIKKVGTLRYDAFEGNHANLSFAAAILDEKDNGFVLNGVYSRNGTTTYLKEIKSGDSVFALSDEERQAIYNAKENYNRKTKKIN